MFAQAAVTFTAKNLEMNLKGFPQALSGSTFPLTGLARRAQCVTNKISRNLKIRNYFDV